MQRPKLRTIRAALVWAMLLAPLLAGCGGGAATTSAADPFIGTWKQVGWETATVASAPLVIAQGADGYIATFVFSMPGGHTTTLEIPLVRQGDKLVGTFRANGHTLRAEVVYLPASGHITWANSKTLNGPLYKLDELVKTSGSTAIPTTSQGPGTSNLRADAVN